MRSKARGIKNGKVKNDNKLRKNKKYDIRGNGGVF